LRTTVQKELKVNITISARHMDVSAPLKAHAEQKANKLTKYYDRIQEIEVIFDAGKDAMQVEMIVNAEHRNMFIARHGGSDAYACVDGCVDKLERQLTEHKKKFRNRKHPEGGDVKRAEPRGSAPGVEEAV
jgi:putative sigma-54 modulation protein